MDAIFRRWVAGGFASASVAVALSACSVGGSSDAWEWQASEDARPSTAAVVSYYFDYPDASTVTVTDAAAVVKIVALRHNVKVEGTADSQPWVYTPMVVEIVQPGGSGYGVGDRVEIAVPGGSVDGFYSPYVWEFNKSDFDKNSLYLMDWHSYDYPRFDLGLVVGMVYELDSSGATLRRLQREPSVGADVQAWTEPSIPVADAIRALENAGTSRAAAALGASRQQGS